MIVILMGTIGGMLLHGIIGLFNGSSSFGRNVPNVCVLGKYHY